jgi:hypothetical protein
MIEHVNDLVNYAKEVAPHIWELAMRQVYVEAIQVSVGMLGCSLAAAMLFTASRKLYNKDPEGDLFMVQAIFGGVFMIGAVFLAVFASSAIIQAVLNPEYAAIKLLKP